MAWLQGMAMLWLRRRHLVIGSLSVVEGARPNWRGIWTGLSTHDFDVYCHRIPFGASDKVLGAALRSALRASRVNVPAPPAWDVGIGVEKPITDARLAEAFGLPDGYRLYPGMKRCLAERIFGAVTLSPTRRRFNGQFEILDPDPGPEHEDISLGFGACQANLGAAIRICFDRCE